jgi:translation elongation factor EF-Ts
MQVAAMNPQYVQFSDVPSALVEEQRQKFLAEMEADTKKPQDIKDKIVA